MAWMMVELANVMDSRRKYQTINARKYDLPSVRYVNLSKSGSRQLPFRSEKVSPFMDKDGANFVYLATIRHLEQSQYFLSALPTLTNNRRFNLLTGMSSTI